MIKLNVAREGQRLNSRRTMMMMMMMYTVFRKKVVYFLNITSQLQARLFLQFLVTITEKLVYKYVILSKNSWPKINILCN